MESDRALRRAAHLRRRLLLWLGRCLAETALQLLSRRALSVRLWRTLCKQLTAVEEDWFSCSWDPTLQRHRLISETSPEDPKPPT